MLVAILSLTRIQSLNTLSEDNRFLFSKVGFNQWQQTCKDTSHRCSSPCRLYPFMICKWCKKVLIIAVRLEQNKAVVNGTAFCSQLRTRPGPDWPVSFMCYINMQKLVGGLKLTAKCCRFVIIPYLLSGCELFFDSFICWRNNSLIILYFVMYTTLRYPSRAYI